MPLTPEQMAEMDAASGYGAPSGPAGGNEALFSKMDEALGMSAPQPVGKVKSTSMGFADSTSFGLDDELRGIGRAIGNKIRGNPMTIDEGIDSLRTERDTAQAAHPGYYAGGQIAGSIMPAVAAPGASLATLFRGGGLAKSAAQGAGIAGGSAFAYGMGAEDGDLGDRVEAGAKAAPGAMLVGAAFPVAAVGFNKLNTRTIFPNSEEIKKAASAAYQKADELGGVMRPEFTNNFLQSARKYLLSGDGLIDAMKSNKPLADAFDDLSVFQNQPMTLQRAQALDEQLGNMIDGFVDAQGNVTKAGKKLLDVQSSFRQMIENADERFIQGGKEGFEALKNGRGLWASSRRLADIERVIENAETYQVPATAIKTGFRRLARNAKQLGYSDEETKALRSAAETGAVTDLMATFGSRLGAIAGGATGGVPGAILGYGASSASRAGATASQMSRANRAAEIVARRSGMVRTEKRIDPLLSMRQLFRLPPKEAREMLALPAPTSARPMTDAQIRAAQTDLKSGGKLKPSNERYDYGDVPYNYVAPPTERVLALPAPQREIISDSAGNARPATPQEQNRNILKRQRAERMGLSPGTYRAIEEFEKKAGVEKTSQLLEKYGVSRVGRFIAKNPRLRLVELDEATLKRMLDETE